MVGDIKMSNLNIPVVNFLCITTRLEYELLSWRIACSAIAVREKEWVCFPKGKHVPYYPALRGCPENIFQSRSGRGEMASGGEHLVGWISRSLTGGSTSWVKPLPIQITLIAGFSPHIYVRLLTRKTPREKRGRVFSRELEKAGLSASGS